MHNGPNEYTGSLPWLFKALCNIPSRAHHPHSGSSSSAASCAGCENLRDRALLRPPPPPPCFLQDSWTVSHDQRNHPPSHCSLRLPVKFLWVILCGKNCCNECNVVARQIMRLCWCSVSSGDIFWVVEHCFASLCSHKCFDAYAFRFSNQGKELEVWSCFCWYKNVLNL